MSRDIRARSELVELIDHGPVNNNASDATPSNPCPFGGRFRLSGRYQSQEAKHSVNLLRVIEVPLGRAKTAEVEDAGNLA